MNQRPDEAYVVKFCNCTAIFSLEEQSNTLHFDQWGMASVGLAW
jgi:hypothetical protein